MLMWGQKILISRLQTRRRVLIQFRYLKIKIFKISKINLFLIFTRRLISMNFLNSDKVTTIFEAEKIKPGTIYLWYWYERVVFRPSFVYRITGWHFLIDLTELTLSVSLFKIPCNCKFVPFVTSWLHKIIKMTKFMADRKIII